MRIEIDIEGNITEHEDAPVIEQTKEDLLLQQINEAKEFLYKTDKKVLSYYEFAVDDNPLEWYVEERRKAREFIRSNT